MNFFRYIFSLISLTCIAQPKEGIWRGNLHLNTDKHIELPFNFEIKSNHLQYNLIIYNGQERILVDEVTFHHDSLNFKMPVFDSEFKTQLIGDTLLSGIWVNHSKTSNNQIAFTASFGYKDRFNVFMQHQDSSYVGKWETTFSPGQKDSSKAIGQFNFVKHKNIIEGTFLTETGDYRYLEGALINRKMHLSSFDGAHAFLFIAEHFGADSIKGDFYSGSSWHENWVAKRNEIFELRDPETLTFVKHPDEKINFSFYNSAHEKISLDDEQYKNKPVIIQIMGSWCPNCMDESAYLAHIYSQYHKHGLEIIALAYERTNDTEKAKANINRFVKRLNIEYQVLITGLSGKEKATDSLPFLNKIMAFPTTLFLDKTHQVKSIYTGFNGPATGKAHEKYKLKTELLIKNLLEFK